MNTEIRNALKSANDKTQYDERAKRLLAQKSILAHILVNTVDEFKGMNPEEVVSYIEGEPYIGIVPVEPGLTNIDKKNSKKQRIIGINTENLEINEGLVRFDIIFYVRMKDGLSQIIVNVEAQKDVPIGYNILNRAIFYVCRMVSSQKERDFINMNYDDIKRVVSIWICMNMKENSMNCYHLINDRLLGNYEWSGKLDMLNIVIIGLSKDLPQFEKKYELHRLLGALLSDSISQNEKLNIIEKEYNISIENDIREEVYSMCNLGEGIEERAIIKNTVKIIINMYNNNFTLEQIALATDKSIDDVRTIIDENK